MTAVTATAPRHCGPAATPQRLENVLKQAQPQQPKPPPLQSKVITCCGVCVQQHVHPPHSKQTLYRRISTAHWSYPAQPQQILNLNAEPQDAMKTFTLNPNLVVGRDRLSSQACQEDFTWCREDRRSANSTPGLRQGAASTII